MSFNVCFVCLDWDLRDPENWDSISGNPSDLRDGLFTRDWSVWARVSHSQCNIRLSPSLSLLRVSVSFYPILVALFKYHIFFFFHRPLVFPFLTLSLCFDWRASLSMWLAHGQGAGTTGEEPSHGIYRSWRFLTCHESDCRGHISKRWQQHLGNLGH